MELRHLRYFVAVAEELNFSRAARRIGIEQSPLSRAIRELEADLGVALFVRNTRGTRVTSAGSAFLICARHILSELRQARRKVQSAAGDSSPLRVGLTNSIATPRVLQMLALLREIAPEIQAAIVNVPMSSQLEALESGSIHLALAPVKVSSDRWVIEPVWRSSLIAAVALSHPLAGIAHPVSLAELEREGPLVCHPELQQVCGALRNAHTIGAVENLPLMLDIVATSSATGILIQEQLSPNDRLRLQPLQLEDAQLAVSTYAIYRPGISTSSVCRELVAGAREADSDWGEFT